jgi:rhamnose utilization protein RhaD (predicted bifunctional aldolase and dehydrogenase)
MHEADFRSMIAPETLAGLARMSARIGGDRLLTQGPGGNSSIKDGEELWVKASGHWLAEAEAGPIFVPLALSALRDGEGRPLAEAPPSAVIADRNRAGLKPSIETMLHALMPQPVVIHAHAINTMATSVLADGRRRAGERLAGLRWRWIGYSRPGAPLARAVAAALAAGPADILVLQNHGLVVGGADFDRAERLLHEVERRLALPAREPPAARAEPAVQEDEGFERHRPASAWAMDGEVAAVLTGHTLVPDQVVFLGGPLPLWPAGTGASAAAARVAAATGVRPALLMRPGAGAVAARDRTAAADRMIEALIELARRLPAGAEIRGLSDEEVAALANWEAEHYRRNLDAARK